MLTRVTGVRAVVFTVIWAVSVGCTGPEGPEIDGRWLFQAQIGEVCDISGRTLVLDQSGDQFQGQAVSGTFRCDLGDLGTTQESMEDGEIRNGRIEGDSVFFEMENVTIDTARVFEPYRGVMSSPGIMRGGGGGLSWTASRLERVVRQTGSEQVTVRAVSIIKLAGKAVTETGWPCQ